MISLPTISRPLLAAALLVASTLPLDGQVGAWTKKEGGYYFGISFASTSADRDYGFEGEERPLFLDTARFAEGTIGISNVGMYGEYGFTDDLTGVLSTYYSVAVREAAIIERGSEGLQESQSASGLGETWVGLRYAVPGMPRGLAVGLNALWKIPTGSANKEVPLGTGRADYDFGLGLGTGFGPIGGERYGWVQASGAYRIRGARDNEIPYSIDAGVPLSSTFALHLLFDGIHSFADFESAAVREQQQNLSSLVGSSSFTRLTGGILYDLNDYTQLSIRYGQVLAGRNTLDSYTIGVGVAWIYGGE